MWCCGLITTPRDGSAETIKTLLPRKYAVTVDIQPPPQGKDYNDCLCMRLGLPITKRGERSKER